MKVAVVSASPREGSNSLRVAEYIAKVVQSRGVSEVNVIDFALSDIPMVGRGIIQNDALTPFQSNLIRVWGEADLVIFTLPEYNWSTSGEFINALHQLGGQGCIQMFTDKVFALVGVSIGRGGRTPIIDIGTMLNKLIGFLGTESVVSAKVFESHGSSAAVTESGESAGNETYEKSVNDFVAYNLSLSTRFKKN